MSEKYENHKAFLNDYEKCKKIKSNSIIAYVWDNYEKQIRQLVEDGEYEEWVIIYAEPVVESLIVAMEIHVAVSMKK